MKNVIAFKLTFFLLVLTKFLAMNERKKYERGYFTFHANFYTGTDFEIIETWKFLPHIPGRSLPHPAAWHQTVTHEDV